MDTAGNIIAALSFTDKLFFYGDSISLNGLTGVELMKLDSSGNRIWNNLIAGDRLGTKGLATDCNSNILVTGDLSDQIITSKYDTDCNLVWTRTAGGTNLPDYGYFIESDTAGNIFIAGLIQPSNSVYFDTCHLIIPSGAYKISYLAKYSATGIIQWVRFIYSLTFAQYSVISSIKCLENGSVVIVGEYSDNFLRFSNGYSSVGPQQSGFSHSYLACFSTSGIRLWVKVPPNLGSGTDGNMELVINASSIFVINSFTGTTANESDTIVGNGSNDLLLEKFDLNGNLNSYVQFGGVSMDIGNDIMVNGNAIYIVGGTSSHPFNVNQNSFNHLNSNSAYVIKLLDNTVGLSENNNEQTFAVYPNPNDGEFIVELPQVKGELTLIDLSGKVIYRSTEVAQQTLSIHQPDLQNGIYFLRFVSADFNVIKKIVIAD
ncbi:MAG: T9SS type A sorting domain-containing protein [Bacteroidia bacterium]